MLKYIIPLLILATFIVSCSKDSPTGTTTDTFVKAKAGSTFTYDEYSTDSLNAMVAGSRDTVVSTVLRTDATIAGKTGVLVVEDRRGNSRDTGYFAYETNNNLSMLAGATATVWMTIPVGTGITFSSATADSSEALGVMTVGRDSTIISLLGTESMIVKGQSVSIKKMQMTSHTVITFGGVIGFDARADIILYYAPSLGFVVKSTSPSQTDPGGGWIDGSYQTLIDYDLK